MADFFIKWARLDLLGTVVWIRSVPDWSHEGLNTGPEGSTWGLFVVVNTEFVNYANALPNPACQTPIRPRSFNIRTHGTNSYPHSNPNH